MSISGGQTSVANLNVIALTVSLLPGSGPLGGGTSLKPNLFVNGGATFDDGGQGASVGILGVKASGTFINNGGLTVNSGGNSPGVIQGAGPLTVAGGTLTLSGNNTFTGGTTINAGATLSVPGIGGSASPLGPSGTLTFRGGTLIYTGNVEASTSRTVDLNSAAGGTINLSGAELQLGGPVLGYAANPGGSALVITTGGGSAALTLTGGDDNAYVVADVEAGALRLLKSSSPSTHAVAGISNIASGAVVQVGAPGDTDREEIYGGPAPLGGVNMSGGSLVLLASEDFDRITGFGSVRLRL